MNVLPAHFLATNTGALNAQHDAQTTWILVTAIACLVLGLLTQIVLALKLVALSRAGGQPSIVGYLTPGAVIVVAGCVLMYFYTAR